jgi:hypothetical protein
MGLRISSPNGTSYEKVARFCGRRSSVNSTGFARSPLLYHGYYLSPWGPSDGLIRGMGEQLKDLISFGFHVQGLVRGHAVSAMVFGGHVHWLPPS